LEGTYLVIGGDIFSGGPGEVPVGKSASLQLPAYISGFVVVFEILESL
jgi:hypothetical protein